MHPDTDFSKRPIRVYLTKDNFVYMLRDIKPGHCQYAVQNGREIEWHDCPEGVEFGEIQPLTHEGFKTHHCVR